jgi:hypothetical protein
VDMARFSLAFTPDPSPAAAIALAEAALAKGAESLILLACDANDCRPEQFDGWLRRLTAPICGGVFPQLIHDWKNHERGYIVVGLPDTVTVYNIQGLSDPGADFTGMVEDALGDRDPPQSLLVLVDGLSSRIGGTARRGVRQTWQRPGLFRWRRRQPEFSIQTLPVLESRGMLVDHAQLTVLPWPFGLGVEHGWEKFAGPFVVTDSTRNVIHSLDFRPAFEVYREHVEADSGRSFTDDNFFDIAKGYPFGLEKPDGSILVRDPISRGENDLNCVGEVPSNSVVHLLKGQTANLIRAAAAGAAAVPLGNGTGNPRGLHQPRAVSRARLPPGTGCREAIHGRPPAVRHAHARGDRERWRLLPGVLQQDLRPRRHP